MNKRKRKGILLKLILFCILSTLFYTIKNKEESGITILSASIDTQILSNGKEDNHIKLTPIEVNNTQDNIINVEYIDDELELFEDEIIQDEVIQDEVIQEELKEVTEEVVDNDNSTLIKENKDENISTNSKPDMESASKNILFEVTFYTSLDGENEYGAITASGIKLGSTMLLANNIYPFGTKIYLEGFGELEVQDRGGKEFNSSNRLDIYIPRKQGESDSEYKKRVIEYGRQNILGRIL